MSSRSEIRKEIDRIKKNYTLEQSQHLRKLKRKLEAIDIEEKQQELKNSTKRVQKHREKIANQNQRRTYGVYFV